MNQVFVYDRRVPAPRTVQEWPEPVHTFLEELMWTEKDNLCSSALHARIVIITLKDGTRTWIPLRPLAEPRARLDELVERSIALAKS